MGKELENAITLFTHHLTWFNMMLEISKTHGFLLKDFIY